MTGAERQRQSRIRKAAHKADQAPAEKGPPPAASDQAPGPALRPGESPTIAIEHIRRWPYPTASWTASRLGRSAAMQFARALVHAAEQLPQEPQPGR
ncbi:hypothetical protein [Bradyrhizobium sp. F1.13.3]|uniref:hypothetical protein n=1 Tax=Bradyrhizobium sp. F1.13.3 TaxID=3156351 RepID=UPI003392C2C6